MTYLVNEKCIKCKLMDCVDVCPVDCFYEGKNMLVIKPDECIDCGVCEPECPVDAIVPDTAEGSEKWLEINTKYSEIWPNISEKKIHRRITKSTRMKKINLKNILKKTFKKKVVKKKSIKVKKVKKVLVKKTKNSIKVKKLKNLKKKNIAKIKEPEKNVSLRISKQNELKPEIKKIKKQETEKKLFKLKDYVVYPKHGVGQILSINAKTIGGIEVQCYDIKFEKDKAVGLLPINKQSFLRPLSTINQVNKCISILKGKPKIKRSMWSRRAQEYEQKITSGKIYELAEVVRDLNKGDDIMVDQSYSERQLFEKAYERMSSEFQIILNISSEETQKKLNKALKRNLESQTPKIETKQSVPTESTDGDDVSVVEEEQE